MRAAHTSSRNSNTRRIEFVGEKPDGMSRHRLNRANTNSQKTQAYFSPQSIEISNKVKLVKLGKNCAEKSFHMVSDVLFAYLYVSFRRYSLRNVRRITQVE